MTAPRHLWSGDWQRESAAAGEELARRGAPTEQPAATPPPVPPEPSGPSAAARALTRLRRLAPRGAVLMALAMLVSAAVGYAAVSALVGGGNGGSATASKASTARPPAAAAAPGWLGVDAISFPLTGGALVVDVAPGSPADAAGLQPGDVITQIGNRPVQSPADLDSALAGMHPGQRVEIQYQQGPITNTTQATLGTRPANGP